MFKFGHKKTKVTESLPTKTGAPVSNVRLGDDGTGGDLKLLDPIPQDRWVTVEFQNVSGWVPKSFKPPSMVPKFGIQKKPDKEKDLRQILFGLTGTCDPGSVLALMGPSGSGKTSLLSVLGGRTPPVMTLEGQALFNGARLTKRLKRKVGFVLQDDLLYEQLTVYETLFFAAMLRLPSTMSNAEKKQRVETVIRALGLTTCRNTIIGGFFQRGVSGGERKRVSVGHELLIDPSILMLDEPTSGLDSTTALHLLKTLRTLAEGHRAVVCTIHQPASRLYQMLDKLLLLSKGHMMYYGEAQAVAEWFQRLGYAMPYGVNSADFILDMASGDVYTKKLDGEESRKHCIECSEHYLQHRPCGYLQGGDLSEELLGSQLWSAAESRRKLAVEPHNSGNSGKHLSSDLHSTGSSSGIAANGLEDIEMGRKLAPMEAGPTTGKQEARWGASYPTQLRILFIRMLKTRRFEALGTQDVVQFLVVGILSGLFWLQKGQSDLVSETRSTSGLLFFEMMFMSMRAMLSALFTFPPNFKIMVKERSSGMYRVSAFYFARMASDIPIDLLLPTVFINLVYWMGGLRYTAQAFFANWAAVLLLVLVAQSLGLVIGALVPFPKTAQTITTVVALSMVLVAGFFVTGVPVWIGWLKWISFIFYGYNLLLHIEYQGRTLWNCQSNHPATDPVCVGKQVSGESLKDALGLYANPNTWPWQALALVGFLLGLRAMVYFALRYKTKTAIR